MCRDVPIIMTKKKVEIIVCNHVLTITTCKNACHNVYCLTIYLILMALLVLVHVVIVLLIQLENIAIRGVYF